MGTFFFILNIKVTSFHITTWKLTSWSHMYMTHYYIEALSSFENIKWVEGIIINQVHGEVLLENLIIILLINKFPTHYDMRKFNTTFTEDHVSRVSSNHSISYFHKIHYIYPPIYANVSQVVTTSLQIILLKCLSSPINATNLTSLILLIYILKFKARIQIPTMVFWVDM